MTMTTLHTKREERSKRLLFKARKGLYKFIGVLGSRLRVYAVGSREGFGSWAYRFGA